MIFSNWQEMLAGIVNKDMKWIGILRRVLCTKVSLPPLGRSFDFHPASLCWNFSTTGCHTVLHYMKLQEEDEDEKMGESQPRNQKIVLDEKFKLFLPLSITRQLYNIVIKYGLKYWKDRTLFSNLYISLLQSSTTDNQWNTMPNWNNPTLFQVHLQPTNASLMLYIFGPN